MPNLKGKLMRDFKRVVLNQTGAAAYFLSFVIAGVGITVSYILEQDKAVIKEVVKDVKRQEGNLVVDKIATMANYLISSNVIACKSDPFKGTTEKNRCIWTGKQYSAGSLIDIAESKLGFTSKGYDSNGFLVYDIDTSKITVPEDLEGADYKLTKVKGELGFKLYNFKDDYLGISDSFGAGIPIEYIDSDNDSTVVLVKATVKYGEQYKLTQSVDEQGNIVKKQVLTPGFTVKKYFGLRRPIAIPRITLDQAICKAGCRPGVNQDNNPDCRSAQNFEYSDEVKLNGTIVNQGPGILYGLTLSKEIEYDKTLFPNLTNPDPMGVDIFASSGKDYLLPGDKVHFTDSVVCLTFNTVVDQTITQSTWQTDANGNPVCWDQSGNTVDCSGSAESGISQHTQPGGKINYKLEIAQIPTAFATPQMINSIFGILPKIPFTFQIPTEFENRSPSSIEPMRVVEEINVVGDVPSKENVTANVNIIATH